MKYGMLLVLALTVLVGCGPTQPTGQTLSGERLTESQRLNQWLGPGVCCLFRLQPDVEDATGQ